MLKYKIDEEKNIQIDDEKFAGLINDDLQEIILALQSHGYDVRIVGGAVRDILLGQTPRDIDLITDAKPDEIIFVLAELDIEADTWGIKHGTVKAVIKKVKYEITSLNYQIGKDKEGKIYTVSGGDWEEDAKRRDFTVNAMSMTLDGLIYDYLDGEQDLIKQIVRPIPDFEEKIQRDPVVILRFFKMVAKFEHPKFSKETLKIVIRNKDLINQLEAKRIRRELGNIRKSVNGVKTIDLMKKTGIYQVCQSALKGKKQ